MRISALEIRDCKVFGLHGFLQKSEGAFSAADGDNFVFHFIKSAHDRCFQNHTSVLRLPQVAGDNTPQPQDAAGECLLYDEL